MTTPSLKQTMAVLSALVRERGYTVVKSYAQVHESCKCLYPALGMISGENDGDLVLACYTCAKRCTGCHVYHVGGFGQPGTDSAYDQCFECALNEVEPCRGCEWGGCDGWRFKNGDE